MICRQARRLLDGQQNRPRAPLPASEQTGLRAHLAACPGCARFARALDEGLPALKRLPAVPPNPRVLAMLAELPTHWWERPAILRLRWRAGRATAFAGAALLVALVSGILTSVVRPHPQAPASAAAAVPAMAGAAPPGAPAAVDCATPDPASAGEKALLQAVFTAIATTLGLTPEQLKAELGAGRGIGELAARRNLSEAQVQATGVAAGRDYLAGAVRQGTMAQAEADKWSRVLPDLVAKTLAPPAAGADPPKANPPKEPASAQPAAAIDGLTSAVVAAAAGQLGLTAEQLMTELRNGAPIGSLARERGIALDTVRAAMLGAGQAHIGNQAASGALSAEQVADLTAMLPLLVDKLTAAGEPQTSAKPGAPCAGGKPGAPGTAANVSIPFDALQAGAATALGLSPERLRQELAAGKSIAALARERNAEPAQVKAAMSRAGTEYLALAVRRGDLTRSQADELARELPDFVEKAFQIVERDPAGRGKPGE